MSHRSGRQRSGAMAHKDIRIPFEVDGRKYEAVGFLNEGETLVFADAMFERTSKENGGAIGDEDEAFLSERRAKLPAELRQYYLATARLNPCDPWYVSYFNLSPSTNGWRQDWGGLGPDCRWGGLFLVLRRCA